MTAAPECSLNGMELGPPLDVAAIQLRGLGEDIQDAVDAPRFHHQWLPDTLSLERGISPDTVAILKSRGYDVDYAPGVVLAQVAAIVSDGGWLQGASDGRSAAGKAVGY